MKRARSAATREKIRQSMLRSWRSGARRKRRTDRQIQEDRAKNPWEPFERGGEWQLRSDRKKTEERKKTGATIWSFGDRRWVTSGELCKGQVKPAAGAVNLALVGAT